MFVGGRFVNRPYRYTTKSRRYKVIEHIYYTDMYGEFQVGREIFVEGIP